MTAGWVAPSVRGRALVRRLAGPDAAGRLAAGTWPDARRMLAALPYGAHLATDADRRAARRAAEAATVWQMRVLAGWLPPGATGLVRLAAAPFEIVDIEQHVAWLRGAPRSDPIDLGPLAVAWPRIARATSLPEVRAALAPSAWGDPGGDEPTDLALGLRVGWARRALRVGPTTRPWAHGAMALLVARERFAFERPVAPITARVVDRSIGAHWRSARSIADTASRLPKSAAWVLADVDDPVDLWRAEVALVRRVAADSAPDARARPYRRDALIAILASMLVDVWRVTSAIEAAGSDGGGSEVLGAMAS